MQHARAAVKRAFTAGISSNTAKASGTKAYPIIDHVRARANSPAAHFLVAHPPSLSPPSPTPSPHAPSPADL